MSGKRNNKKGKILDLKGKVVGQEDGHLSPQQQEVKGVAMEFAELGLELQRLAQASLHQVELDYRGLLDELHAERAVLPQYSPGEMYNALVKAGERTVMIIQQTAYSMGQQDLANSIKEAAEDEEKRVAKDGGESTDAEVPAEPTPEPVSE